MARTGGRTDPSLAPELVDIGIELPDCCSPYCSTNTRFLLHHCISSSLLTLLLHADCCNTGELRRPPGHHSTTWMKNIQQDLKSSNLSRNEASDVTFETDVYIWHYALTVVHVRNEEATTMFD